jgi:predicted RNA-binding protein with RPS1 domain
MTTDQPDLATTDAAPDVPETAAEEAIDLETPVRTLDGPEYIEVDGVQVPNYDLTIPIFSEGDVVTGRVVRVDKDEVLVDIGYKSEGVIPLPELSIRKSVKPEEEVSLGEMVDALVMQKEDQDGRLILSKKRARFEKAWKRIEAAAAAASMRFHAFSKRARFLERISRPSWSSFCMTRASIISPSETSSSGLMFLRMESSGSGMTPSLL